MPIVKREFVLRVVTCGEGRKRNDMRIIIYIDRDIDMTLIRECIEG